MQEVTIGIAGAAGDGLDKSGDTLAKISGRLGLQVYAYNSYQSIIRGGHIWLKLRIGSEKVYNHGDQLNGLIALNQDSIERHAPEIEAGGVVVFNGDKFKCDASQVKQGVKILPLPIAQMTAEIVKEHGALAPIMQNTIAMGAVLNVCQLGLDQATAVVTETFKHKGQKVVDLNISLLKCGYEYAASQAKPICKEWKFSNKARPFTTGNEVIALAAYAAGCKFYSAYPMTPASTILHWMCANSQETGIVVKQGEDELAVMNMTIGAGIAGVRAMCATAGGGFALMTEALGMAGIMEIPMVCVEVQRGGPSTGLPTKTEQADLYQVYGASQGEFPRLIVAPTDIADAYKTTIDAFNYADRYQLPVVIMSDLLLSEHHETVDREVFTCDVKIDRGEIVKNWSPEQGKYKRFAFTESGVSPRSLPGTANTLYVSPSDDHDEESILISDMFTSPPVRRKIMEKRMRKIENLLKELPAPQLEGPKDADVTLVTWGSTYGVVKEAADQLNASGVKTNILCIKYVYPFHAKEVTDILSKSKKKISVELNYTSQMARYIRSETGIGMDKHINKYDGEPYSPKEISDNVKEILGGKIKTLDVTEADAREISYHYLRTHNSEKLRPGKIVQESTNGYGEPTWFIELAERASGNKAGYMKVGMRTGATYAVQKDGESK